MFESKCFPVCLVHSKLFSVRARILIPACLYCIAAMECLLRHAFNAAADLGGVVPTSWWVQGAGATALLSIIYYFLLLPMDWTKVSEQLHPTIQLE